ncbi:hypothetical protein LMF32_12010 [Desemzia sp. C1]|uniref:hypothetical protein n=1 Tax=Desemzia sp. C1 TaxID=2892016 RepID=UPI001E5704A1|nr:hypothetical protein [Desemzia sp. C1]MCI3029769.1 hypothetical protein [Desemzia sp. C1]
MNGKEFLDYYDQIEEITNIEWVVTDEYHLTNGEMGVSIVFTFDGKQLILNYPKPTLPVEKRQMNYIAIVMLVSKCIRQITGHDSLMMSIHGEDVTVESSIASTINYAQHLLREKRGE